MSSLKPYWELLARHIRPQRTRFILLALLMLGSIGLQLVNPQIMRTFIDSALGGGELSGLMWTAAAFIGIALLQQVVAVSVTYLGENVAWTATNELRAELAWHCLNLDMSFHNNHTPGELSERIDGDVTELKRFFSMFVVLLVGNLLLVVGILVVLFFEDWRAGLAFTAFALLAMAVLNRLRNIAVQHQKDRRQAEAELFGFIEEQLNATEDVRSSGAIDFSLRELLRMQGKIMRADFKAHRKDWVLHNSTGGLLTVANILAIVCGYLLFSNGLVTIGTVYLFIHYINLLDTPIWALSHEIQGFQTISACVERLNELRKVSSKVSDNVDGASLASGPLGLCFSQVSFAYQDNIKGANGNGAAKSDAKPESQPQPAQVEPGEPVSEVNPPANGETETPVLRGLSFELAPGRVLGLLGHTGSGKTTLTRLIFRMYDPTTGQITLGGQDLRQASLNNLRQRVGVVTQDVQLFRATVRENLTFFDRTIPDEKILAAVEELGLGDWFRSLPDGLDTLLDSGGHSLSAGEGQLLALTRIFLRSPGLVILDEASSRLDPATEQHIERALDRLLKDRTAIIIAHRLHTVHRADEILILKDGQLSEMGRREDLLRDPNSRFAQLLRTGLEEVLV